MADRARRVAGVDIRVPGGKGGYPWDLLLNRNQLQQLTAPITISLLSDACLLFFLSVTRWPAKVEVTRTSSSNIIAASPSHRLSSSLFTEPVIRTYCSALKTSRRQA